ncbi:MAG: hypothetical protein QXP59_00690 [Saccharolobus sp.]
MTENKQKIKKSKTTLPAIRKTNKPKVFTKSETNYFKENRQSVKLINKNKEIEITKHLKEDNLQGKEYMVTIKKNDKTTTKHFDNLDDAEKYFKETVLNFTKLGYKTIGEETSAEHYSSHTIIRTEK